METNAIGWRIIGKFEQPDLEHLKEVAIFRSVQSTPICFFIVGIPVVAFILSSGFFLIAELIRKPCGCAR